MDKQEFIKAIETLVEMIEFRDNVYDLIHNLKYIDTDFMGADSIILPADSLIISLIARLLTVNNTNKFKDIKETIEWWLYDTECGKNEDYITVTYQDGTEKAIKTPDDLWEDIRYCLN